jgi:hypothetical protein
MRSHGRIESSIWQDGDFRALSTDAQWLYMALLSQTDLSLAGVVHLSRVRWAKLADDMTPERLDDALKALDAGRFLVVDLDDEEVLIRSFARRETQWANPKRRGGYKAALDMVNSAFIRDALTDELRRIGRALDGSEIGEAIETGLPIEDQSRFNPDPIAGLAIQVQSESNPDSDVSRLPSVVDVATASKRVPATKRKRATERGTKAPDVFPPTDSMRAWIADRGIPTRQAKAETEAFLDWHRSKGSTFIDWQAAWRNWMRRVTPENQTPAQAKPYGNLGADGVLYDPTMQ